LQAEHIIIAILSIWSAKLAWQRHKTVIKGWFQHQKDRLPRRWRPKTPEDCPQCQQGVTIEHPQINWDVEPYTERKSRRGRKKSIPTEGYACPNPRCCYFGITSQDTHAVVSHGKRGKYHNIQYFKCQACQKTFSSRRGSVLYYLKTNADRVEFSLWFLAEGIDRSVLVRYSGHVDATLTRWLMRAGRQGFNLHNTYFRHLNIAIIQMDELYAKVRNAQKKAWVWLAIDPISKALPAMHVGGRKTTDAYTLLHDLKLRLDPTCIPVFLTDALRQYYHSITAHMSELFRPLRARKDHWRPHPKLLYAQLVKRKKNRKLKFAVTRMLQGKRRHLYAKLQANGLRPTIQTAFIERVNLTIRQSVSFLTRRTWSTARSEEHLRLHLEWWRCYYHFMRPHQSLAEAISGCRWKRSPKTPAMALGLTDHVWTVRDFIHLPLVAPPVVTSHSP
jgi:IS1 family transposase/transposase-like protein